MYTDIALARTAIWSKAVTITLSTPMSLFLGGEGQDGQNCAASSVLTISGSLG